MKLKYEILYYNCYLPWTKIYEYFGAWVCTDADPRGRAV